MVAAIQFVIAAAIVLWLSLCITLRGRVFEMDSVGSVDEYHPVLTGRHSFHAIFGIYRRIYGGIFGAGIVAAILAPPADNGGVYRVLPALAAVYGLIFVLRLTVHYERRQHLRYPPGGKSPYLGWRYAVTLTLGVMSPVLFAVGLVGLIGALYGQ
jgi:hypothetical protein